MADISKCEGTNCPRKEECYRYTARPDEFQQAYFMDVPLKEDNKCDHFWNKEGWEKSTKIIK